MIVIEAEGKNIVIRGRDKNRKRYVKSITNFSPYFYVQDVNGKYVSIGGIKLRKVYVNYPTDVVKERQKYERTWEADVTYVNRYLIDNYKEIPKEPIRTCFLDIEVNDKGGFATPKEADKEILSIACYDNFKDKYFCFVLSVKNHIIKNKKIKMPDDSYINANIYFLEDEFSLLKKFMKFINDLDFDLIFAFNGENYDFPYVFNRMKNLELKIEDLSPLKSVNKDGYPRGRIWLDIFRCYQKLSQTELTEWSLEYIANKELGAGKIKHESSIYELWRHNIMKLIEYNIVDVWLIVQIEKKKGILEYFDTIRRLSFCGWYDVFNNSRVLDFYFLKCAKELNIVLPTKAKHKHTKIKGARIITPIHGIHENVAVADVRSLYPTAILVCNMSPETLDERGEIRCDNVRFKKQPRGFIPKIVRRLWDLRQKWKKERDKYEFGTEEYNKWDNLQTVAKFLLNSVYGVLIYKNFRLFNEKIGHSVTYFGRRANEWMEAKAKELGYQIVAGDTDSLFFKLKSEKLSNQVKEAQRVVDYINSSLDEFCEKEFGDSTYNIMHVEFEKIYKRIFFGAKGNEAVKKRYAGLIVYKDGKILETPKLEIKGFEAKRSDTPELIRNLQKEIFEMILNSEEKEKIIEKIMKIRNNIVSGKYSPEEIAIPCAITKNLHEYKNLPAHVAGAIYFNKYLNGNVGLGKIKYIYVKNAPANLPKTHVISFIDKAPSNFEYDWEKMATRLIDNIFSRIFECIGWDINEVKNYQLNKFFTCSDNLKNIKSEKWW